MSKDLTIAIEEKWHHGKTGRLQVLDRCHLEIKAGELFVLLGESGCGKTTLIRLILGLDREFTGSILIDNQKVDGPGTNRGIVFQEPRLLPWMTVAQNIQFALPNGLSTEESSKRVVEILAMVGLTESSESWPKELSGGMAQRAALARALVNVPEILLLDEPFGALDLHTRARMQDELLSLLSKTKTTTLLVTHDIDEALYLADHIAVMSSHQGRVIARHKIEWPRPRQRSDQAWLKLRAELLEELLSGSSLKTNT
jgi:sulfonate transport system ATP-binding protein